MNHNKLTSRIPALHGLFPTLRFPSSIMGKRSRNNTASSGHRPVTPLPKRAQSITVDGTTYTAVTEGAATILFPKNTLKTDKNKRVYEVEASVFYNPVQQFNRDLSILAAKAFGANYLEERNRRNTDNYKRNPDKRSKETHRVPTLPSAETLEIGCEVNKEFSVEAGPGPSSCTKTNTKGGTETDEGNPDTTYPNISFSVLDALSATGLRALRYACEIPFITSVTANDLDSSAIEAIRRNLDFNKSNNPTSIAKIRSNLGNAQHHMYSVLTQAQSYERKDRNSFPKRYEVIDLDPYGTAAPFLDAAVQAVADGGMLAVTCTDAGVWASTGYSEKCFSLYGGLPVKGESSHEAGLRLILFAIATAAGKYGCSIEPLLSLSIDFYARVFVRVRKRPAEVKKLASSSMIIYSCDHGCGSWVEQRLAKAITRTNKSGNGTFLKFGLSKAPTTNTNCEHCNSQMHLAGPMWGGDLHCPNFITSMLKSLSSLTEVQYATLPRIRGILETALQETTLSASPLFYSTSSLASVVRCEAPPQAAFRGALLKLGYKTSRSHCKPSALKTDAPARVIWQIMKKWAELKGKDRSSFKEGSVGYSIMSIPAEELEIEFDEELGKEPEKASGVIRYQPNPTSNWGPMGRARGIPSSKADGNEEGPQAKRIK